MNYQEFLRTVANDQQENGNDNGATVIDRPPQLDANNEKVDVPKNYAVLVHNDDHTPFDVVVEVLRQIFGFDGRRAMQIMMAAHTSGKAVVAIMSKDMAETKATQAMDLASTFKNPVTDADVSLQFSTEEQ